MPCAVLNRHLHSSPILLLLCVFGLGSAAFAEVPGDFNGDNKTDIAVFHRTAGTPGPAFWKILGNSDIHWGLSTDTPVPGDYDGDAKTDPAIVRPGSGVNALWAILGSTAGEIYSNFGYNTDIPIPRDYTGEGKVDLTVIRTQSGTGKLFWYVYYEPIANYCTFSWGLSTDKLVPGDYNGDGTVDIAVFRPSEANWYILYQQCPTPTPVPSPVSEVIRWGLSTDRPVPGDYDGDGKYDAAVFRPNDSTWYIRKSSDGNLLAIQWGLSNDIPVPGDYDGDGKFDTAVFRPCDATWYILRSSDGQVVIQQFGASTDIPVPSLYIP